MRVQPLTPEAVVEFLADTIADAAARVPDGGRLRVGVDGAPAAGGAALADALVDPLRVRGRAVLRVSADDFLRPASVRLEHGRENPDAFYLRWLDDRALVREVLAPLEVGARGTVLPSLWDVRRDRATRAERVPLAPGGVLLLDGALLLGVGLPLDVSVHLQLSPAALARRTAPELAWTLPAYTRYAEEAAPQRYADVVLRCDDPRHPALVRDPAG